MSEDISGFGFRGVCRASNTFPLGFTFTQFSDDTNPWDVPSIQVADKAMGLNGDLISWSKASAILLTVSVIPNSENDIAFKILLEANRVGRGKTGARDKITMVGLYPDSSFVTFTDGIITDGMPASGVASAGRLITNQYQFAFENKIEA
jgi:hypothetical protein